MQRFICLAFLWVTVLDFFSRGDKWGRFKLLPGAAGYLFEVMSALVVVLVIVLGVRNRFRYVRPAYWLVFSGFLVVIICGAVVNAVAPGPIFAGIRVYFRAIPWFFIPAVWAFSSEQIKNQLKLLLAICLLQLPFAIEQRIRTADSSWGFVAVTGDWTQGTLEEAGVLSIFLVGAVCLIAAFYERGKLKAVHFIALFLAFLLPTMINETKAMIVFLPMGLIGAFLCATRPEVRGRRIAVGVGMLALFGTIWVPVNDYMMEDREYGTSLEDFFLGEGPGTLNQYLSFGGGVGSVEGIPGRGIAIRVAIQEIATDPVRLIFGLGIGNVSHSSLGQEFTGKHNSVYGRFVIMTFARVIFEFGLLGIMLLYWLYWLILEDCRVMARRRDGLFSDFAAGWAGVVLLMWVVTLYSLVETFSSLAMLFWYFSGLVVAERMRRSLPPDTLRPEFRKALLLPGA